MLLPGACRPGPRRRPVARPTGLSIGGRWVVASVTTSRLRAMGGSPFVSCSTGSLRASARSRSSSAIRAQASASSRACSSNRRCRSVVACACPSNMQMIGADYGFDGTSCRCLSVHSGAILQALARVYPGLTTWMDCITSRH